MGAGTVVIVVVRYDSCGRFADSSVCGQAVAGGAMRALRLQYRTMKIRVLLSRLCLLSPSLFVELPWYITSLYHVFVYSTSFVLVLVLSHLRIL